MLIHATCVAMKGRGILLRGPSGAGKSDLALRLIDAGARLVADDQVSLVERKGRVLASAPAALAGRLEVRGIGIVTLDAAAEAPVALLADLVTPDRIERLPEPATEVFLDVPVPRISLAPFEASAIAKLHLALDAAAAHMSGGIDDGNAGA